MATGTFDGAAFEIYSDPRPRDSEIEIAIHHIPGSSINYVDLGGALPQRVTYTVYTAAAADFAALEAKRGVQGSLVTTEDGTFTAVLLAVHRTRRNWDGATEGTAEFLIVS